VLSAIAVLMALHMFSAVAPAKELPAAPSSAVAVKSSAVSAPELVTAPRPPETRVADTKFFSLAIISTGSAFADSYTKLFARQHWLAGQKGVCNIEVKSAYLYGTHPTVVRTYAVASVISVGAIAAAWYLRKHRRKLWSFPLVANAIISPQGVTQDRITCN
jgi:hypothetical protein